MELGMERPQNVDRTWVEHDGNVEERLQIPGSPCERMHGYSVEL